MKIPSSNLYDLVHVLTKSEKRYIKLQSSSGKNDYIQLLDALLAQKTFDEDKLVRDHKDANFIKHLAVNKQYLYELLLKLLTSFGQKTLENKIYEKISAANVLIEKNMFQAALREVKKGQKIANKYEVFELQIMLSGIEKRILPKKQLNAKNRDVIQEIFEQETNSLEQLKNTNEYWLLSQQMRKFQTQYQKIQNEEQQKYIDGLIQTEKFQNKLLATNFKSKLYYHQVNASYQFMLGNVEQAYRINRDFLDLLEASPHFLKLYAEHYLATLNNMLIDSLIIGKYDILKEGIDRLVKIPERKEFKYIKNIESRVFRQRYLLLINWSLSQNDFEKALDWIPDMEAGLEKFGNKIEKQHRVTFYYLTAYILFLDRNFGEALRWNNLIINDPKEDVVKEIFYFARVLNLLIHFELENYDLLESLLLSTPKFLRSRRTLYKTEKTLFRLLGKILKQINKKEKQKLFTEFQIELDNLFSSPKEKRVFNYLDLRIWLKEKVAK